MWCHISLVFLGEESNKLGVFHINIFLKQFLIFCKEFTPRIKCMCRGPAATYNCSAVFRHVVRSYPRALVHLLDELGDFKGWRRSSPFPSVLWLLFSPLPALRSECEGWKVLVVLFVFSLVMLLNSLGYKFAIWRC